MIKWIVGAISAIVICFSFYKVGQRVGQSEVKIQIVEKQVEVIKYVEKKKADIYSKPNATRDELIGLLSKGKL